MSSERTTMRQAATEKWTAAKPVLTGLVVGLIAGPIISGMAGFQMRTSSAEAAVHAGVVAQQADFCVERARAATPSTTGLSYQARSDLAREWAVMPGMTTPDMDVVYACSDRLSR